MDRTAWVLLAIGIGGLVFQQWWLRKRFGINVAKTARDELSQPVPIRTPLIAILTLIILGATLWSLSGVSGYSGDDFVLLGVLVAADVILIRALVNRWRRRKVST